MPATDTRRVVGSKVMAKACHVTSLAECARRYGSNKNTKELVGTVTDVVSKVTATGRTSTFIAATYELEGGVQKTATLNIRSVNRVPPPTTAATSSTPSPANTTATPSNTNTTNTTTTTTTTPPTPTVSVAATTAAAATAAVPTSNTTADDPQAASADTTAARPADVPTATEPHPTVVVHDQRWYKDDAAAKRDVNGPVPSREWGIRTMVGDVLTKGSQNDGRMSRLDFFLLMFPPRQLDLMCCETSKQLAHNNFTETTKGELLKFFGICILITRFEFGSRASLWSQVAPSKYIPAPAFGKTGMSRHRFDRIWQCLRFGEQPSIRPVGMSSERYRWLLVDAFVDNFNACRLAMYIPSDEICVDESMIRWYGTGGHWINAGLPMYVAIDRKPENGCEVQNAADGKSSIMMKLKLVKTAQHDREEDENAEDEDCMLHGTKVLKYLVESWAYSDRVVCADSYFASVGAAEEMKRLGLRFIGVVKTATKRFPQAYLSGLELQQRGDRKALISKSADGVPNMTAFVWMDRERRYFIASASSIDEGVPYSRRRLRQVNEETDAEPEMVDLVVPQPKAAEIYYRTCGLIDQHNRHRQDTLQIEKKLETKDWSKRVGFSLFGMCVVDTWLAYSQVTGLQGETQSQFYTYLAEELIDNTYDATGNGGGRHRRSPGDHSPELINHATGGGRAGVHAHLSPTRKRRKTKDGLLTNQAKQGSCRVCKMKSRYVCSTCADMGSPKDIWLCHTETGRMCFPTHVSDCHCSG